MSWSSSCKVMICRTTLRSFAAHGKGRSGMGKQSDRRGAVTMSSIGRRAEADPRDAKRGRGRIDGQTPHPAPLVERHARRGLVRRTEGDPRGDLQRAGDLPEDRGEGAQADRAEEAPAAGTLAEAAKKREGEADGGSRLG